MKAAQHQILELIKTRSAYDITEQLLNLKDTSKLLQIFKLAAEQGGIRSYIIYMLYINGKTFYWKIVEETGFTKQHVWQILKDLKEEKIVDSDRRGFWFLSQEFLDSK